MQRFVADPGQIRLCTDSNGAKIRLTIPSRRSIVEGDSEVLSDDKVWYALIGEPYPSFLTCIQSALRAKQSVVKWALRRSIAGIDFGPGSLSEGDSDIGGDSVGISKAERLMAAGVAIERIDSHSLHFIIHMLPTRDVRIDSFTNDFRGDFPEIDTVNPKLVVSIELYLLSLLNTDERTRFVTQVTAIEALLERSKEGARLIELVQKLKAVLATFCDPNSDEAVIVKNALGRAKQESITKAGKRLVNELLGSKDYEGIPAATLFDRMYEVRSQIVHNGLPKQLDPGDFRMLCNLTSGFVRDVLDAAIDQRVLPTRWD
jgi:hypothetical protein